MAFKMTTSVQRKIIRKKGASSRQDLIPAADEAHYGLFRRMSSAFFLITKTSYDSTLTGISDISCATAFAAGRSAFFSYISNRWYNGRNRCGKRKNASLK